MSEEKQGEWIDSCPNCPSPIPARFLEPGEEVLCDACGWWTRWDPQEGLTFFRRLAPDPEEGPSTEPVP